MGPYPYALAAALVAGLTTADGRFTISNVPTSFGGIVLHAFPAKPGVDFAPEVAISLGRLNGTDVGDGWLIFDAPQADLGVHPTEGTDAASGRAEISFWCDDVVGTWRVG